MATATIFRHFLPLFCQSFCLREKKFTNFSYNERMRVDKFLNVTNITKRRAVAEDMCKSGVVSINGVVAKPSREVREGDEIEIRYIEQSVRYAVVGIPAASLKSTPKSDQGLYVRKID